MRSLPTACSGTFCSTGGSSSLYSSGFTHFVLACSVSSLSKFGDAHSPSLVLFCLLKLFKDISSVQPEEERGTDKMNSDKDNCVKPL